MVTGGTGAAAVREFQSALRSRPSRAPRAPRRRPKAPSVWEQTAGLVTGAPRALGALVAGAARESYRLSPIDDIVEGVQDRDPLRIVTAVPRSMVFPIERAARRAVEAWREGDDPGFQALIDSFARESPVIGTTIQSLGRTLVRAGQTTASLAPGGMPAFEPYRQASREGAIVGTIIEDIGNAALVLAPIASGLASKATRAASQATVARQATRAAAREFQQAISDRGAAMAAARAAAREPAANAALLAADETVGVAARRLRAARAAEREAAAAAERAAQVAQRARRYTRGLGRVADSPFAPLTIGVPRVARTAGRVGLRGLQQTERGQALLNRAVPLVGAVQERLATVGEDRAARRMVQHAIEEGDIQLAREPQMAEQASRRITHLLARTEPRGLRRRPVPVRDELAERAVPLLLTGEARQMAAFAQGLRNSGLDATQVRRAAVGQTAEAMRALGVEPDLEALEFAYDVLDPQTRNVRAREVAQVWPEVERLYREAIAAPAAARYRESRGDVQGRQVSAETAEHNITGVGPSTVHLRDFQRRMQRLESVRERQAERTMRAGQRLMEAQERLDLEGLTDAERADPASLVRRVYEPAVQLARSLLADPDGLAMLREVPEGRVARIVESVADGRLPQPRAVELLADELVRLAGMPKRRLSGPARRLVAAMGDEPVPRPLPTLQSTRTAVMAGRAGERVEQGMRQIRAGQEMETRGVREAATAADRLRAEVRESPKVRAATERLVRAVRHAQDLAARVRAARAELEQMPPEMFARSRSQMRAAAREIHRAVVANRRAMRDEMLQVLDNWEALDIVVRRRERPRMREVRDPNVKGGWRKIPDRRTERMVDDADAPVADLLESLPRRSPVRRHIRFADDPHVQGRPFDEVLDMMAQAGMTPDLHEWARMVEAAYQSLPDPGFVRNLVGGDDAFVDYLSRLPARLSRDALEELTDRLMRQEGPPAGRVGEAVEQARAADLERELEGLPGRPGRQALRSRGARAAYDVEAEAGKARVQELIVGQRAGQVAEAARQAAEQAREQGRRAGQQIGRGEGLAEAGRRVQRAGERLVEQAEPVAAARAEASLVALARGSGPVGRLYRRVGQRERAALEAARTLAREQRVLARLDRQMQRAHARALQQIEAEPARYRPLVAVGRVMHKQVTDLADQLDKAVPGAGDPLRAAAAELLVTSKRAFDEGIDPVFLIGKPKPAAPSRLSGPRDYSPGAELPVRRATGHLSRRHTGVRHGQTLADVVAAERRRLAQIIANETGERVKALVGRPIRDVLRERGMSDAEINAMDGGRLRQAIEDGRMWAAWDPGAAHQELGSRLTDAEITPDTVVIPASAWREFRRYAEGRFGTAENWIDIGHRVWKGGVLALTGRWHAGNIIGNAIMAMLGAGLTPGRYWRAMGQARQILRATDMGQITPEYQAMLERMPSRVRAGLARGAYAPPELLRRGLAASDWQRIAFPEELAVSKLRHPIRWSYEMNGFIDDVNRLAVYLDRLDRGLTDTDIRYFRQEYPELVGLSRQQLEQEAAIRLSLRAMGDFTKMRPWERKIVKRILPFWPWLRHITKLSGNLVIHHPVRVAWTLHLVDVFDDEEDLVPFLRGAVPVGENLWLRLPNINPFADVLGAVAVGDEGYEPEGVLASVSPLITTGAAALLGMDVRSARDLPSAIPALDRYGRPRGRPLITRPRELAYMLGSQIPQFAAAREAIPALWGSRAVRRYPGGEPYVVGGRFIPANQQYVPGTRTRMPDVVAPFIPLLGVPRVEYVDTASIEGRITDRRRRAAQEARNYARSRERARVRAARGDYLDR